MTDPPKLSDIDLWGYYERRFLKFLSESLATMAGQSPFALEPELNDILFVAVIDAMFNDPDRDDLPAFTPEAKNPPNRSDTDRTGREEKKPDLRWAFNDPQATNSDDWRKEFVVECKRLANPISHFAKEYVKSGIDRFVNPGWGYAQNMESGVMVGYVQEVNIRDAVTNVSRRNKERCIPEFTNDETCGEAHASFEHCLDRPFPISPFRLSHIWARIGPEPGSRCE